MGRPAVGPPAESLRRSSKMPAKIHIERMMHRASIAVQGESAASYALLKLIPTGEGAVKGGRPISLR